MSIKSEQGQFPLFKPFWSVERANCVHELMKGNSNDLIHKKTGVNANSLSTYKFLRFCPICLEEDDKKYGEAYWHRLHQVPGILVCPVHREVLLDSTVLVYGINPQYFEAANKENCKVYKSIIEVKASTIDKLVMLAGEAQMLLNNKTSAHEYYWFIDKYKYILKQKGLLSRKGYVDQNSLVSGFIEYYTPELLNVLGLMPKLNNKHNWVSMMTRKSKDYPHPIEHLLFIGYLNISIFEFFNINSKINYSITESFDRGSYICLNAASNHYRQSVITDVELCFSRNNNLIATYKCSCGFTYTRVYSGNEKKDGHKYDSVKSYGELWENKFRELVEDKELHLREVAKHLNIDLKTVRKHIFRLNLKSKWLIKRFPINLKCNVEKQKASIELEKKRKDYRKRWLTLMELNKGISKTKLREFNRNLYYWLEKYDKKWIDINKPIYEKTKVTSKISWDERDIRTKDKVQSIVNRLLNPNSKIIRITDYRIGKELHMTYALRNHLDKMPLTKAFLESVCEDVETFRIRRIKNAIRLLCSQGQDVKAWKIKKMTGLNKEKSVRINQYIQDEISYYKQMYSQ